MQEPWKALLMGTNKIAMLLKLAKIVALCMQVWVQESSADVSAGWIYPT